MTADLSGNIGSDSQSFLMQELTSIEQQRSKLRLQQGKLILEAAKARVIEAGISEPIVKQRHDCFVEALIELENDLCILVIGLHAKIYENQSGKIGAKLESMIRSLHKPILVVNDSFKAPQRIILAYDGSPAANKALDMLVTSPFIKG